ncbi:MAG: hypothetical protein M1300_04065 [Epsilonproteobacteria bacterium]|nr:hypothetical protein [Campylobacterota bacterium]
MSDHAQYIEDQKFKSNMSFDDDTDILYTPDNWEPEDHDGKEGVTGKYILDVCGGDYGLAGRVYSLCEWQHPETILDEMNIQTSDLYLIRLDETQYWNDEFREKYNTGKIYGIYLVDMNNLTNVAELRPSVWCEFLKNEVENLNSPLLTEENQDDSLHAFEHNSGGQDGKYIIAEDIKRIIDDGANAIKKEYDFKLPAMDYDCWEDEFKTAMGSMLGNYSDFTCEKMSEIGRKNKSENTSLADAVLAVTKTSNPNLKV